MNDVVKSVLTSVVMSVLGVIGAWLIKNGLVSADDWAKLGPGVAAIVVAGLLMAWAAMQRTEAAKTQAMKDVTGTTVVVDMTTASPAVKKLAVDPSVDHVEARTPPTAST